VLPILGLGLYAWSLSGSLETARYKAQTAELRTGITNASLQACQGHLDAANARAEESARKLEEVRLAAAADQARSAERWRGTKAQIDVLVQESKGADSCEPSPAALKMLEKL
jgi:hypothetical protein